MKTPRTNARLVKYRDGSLAAFFKRRICYADFARELEVETQELVAALRSAVKWLIMIDERRSDVPQWLRHDADPRPLRKKIEQLLKDASAETATPAPHPDAARIDWLKECSSKAQCVMLHHMAFVDCDLRAAIDAAMNGGAK